MAARDRPKLYEGKRVNPERRTASDSVITVDGRPLKHIENHSSEMNWGYGGAGPADLALSILADYLEDRELAYKHYQDFKFAHVAVLPQEGPWTITGYEIEHWLKDRKGV